MKPLDLIHILLETNHLAISYKVDKHLPCNPTTPLLDIQPGEMKPANRRT